MEVPTHSIILEEARCVGCVACCKACPTKAVRVKNDLMRIDPTLCIDCGACIRACRYDAVRPRTSTTADLKRFRHTVAVPSMTLFTQFGHDVHPWQVAGALKACGFDAFHDTSPMCPMVSSAVDTFLSECQGPWPKISVTCPAIIRLILIRYPDLIPHLIPIHTPRELAAKLARRQISARLGIPPAEIGVFYVSPCAAILESIQRPVGVAESYFDGGFSVAELYGPLLRAIRDGASEPEESFEPRGLLWAASGGEAGAMRNANVLSVTGVDDVTYVFDCIEAGKFRQVDFLEAYICPDGCVSGPLLVEGRYAARHTLQRLQAQMTSRPTIKEERVRSLFREYFFHMEDEIKARPLEPVASNLRGAILRRNEKNRLLEELPRKDCAACGAPDCATLAEDVVAGRARLDDCLFLKVKQAKPLPEETGHE